jgi:hypothetical protein
MLTAGFLTVTRPRGADRHVLLASRPIVVLVVEVAEDESKNAHNALSLEI